MNTTQPALFQFCAHRLWVGVTILFYSWLSYKLSFSYLLLYIAHHSKTSWLKTSRVAGVGAEASNTASSLSPCSLSSDRVAGLLHDWWSPRKRVPSTQKQKSQISSGPMLNHTASLLPYSIGPN